MYRMTSKRCRGFSLIELVITIVIMGILSAVVMISIGAQAQHSVTTQADKFRRALSQLQLVAISQGARLKLTVTPNAYTVSSCPDSNCLGVVTDPATGQSFSVTLTDGVEFTRCGAAPPCAAADFYFDSLGRPVTADSTLVPDPTSLIFKLNNVGRDQDVTVTVLPITGFARTSYN